MTNVVEFRQKDLTPSERARAERLVWTEDLGRGWKARPITSSDSQFLTEVLERLDARLQPADRVAVIGAIARLANHFRADRPADAWQMLFEDYAADLDGISEAHLSEAIRKYRASKPFFPKVAELVEIWNGLRLVEAEQHRRARVLLGIESPKPWEAA